ncbi:ABC transporter permease [Frankia sp. CNm7]|uniref:ABC transporter permease n=1 Tax=Frankia nepalensis TaxID=1836974 RepID=A0A937RJ54_9ACTN|nr:ABC transporter permease [Frankia nepalensis]MBL7498684.1 ABC transporter permease [Frankia nepalensis]MBL7509151.1 ABC transporter permease [Frankia nepalensis]MBL7518781.1 ABC transporter permease [Frankia nepalensis]MBL7633231.1 ABC transporter permease [Frankia nepalensis]
MSDQSTMASAVSAALAAPADLAGTAVPDDSAGAAASVVTKGRRTRAGRRIGVGGCLAVGWLGLLVVAAVTAQWLPLDDYDTLVGDPGVAPFADWSHPLGTDGIGRDALSRLVYGARASLVVSVGAAALGLLVGGLIGVLAGYLRGWVEAVVDVLANTLLAFPPLIMLLALASVVSPTLWTLAAGLALLAVPPSVRLAKANVASAARREYVLVAEALGARRRRVVARELIPNVVPPLVSFAFVGMAALIVAEGSLSFLGLGIPPPSPSWGGMIAAGKDDLADHPAFVFVPCAAMFLTVLALNTMADLLGRRLDVRESML